MAKFLVLHGPNLDKLGHREPNHYGCHTLDSVNKNLKKKAKELGHTLEDFQSNAEHELIDRIDQAEKEKMDCIIFNPAALTHTSIALRDALLCAKIPFIEIHISNIHKRESFRHHSFFSDIAIGVMAGLGTISYELALLAAIDYLQSCSSLDTI